MVLASACLLKMSSGDRILNFLFSLQYVKIKWQKADINQGTGFLRSLKRIATTAVTNSRWPGGCCVRREPWSGTSRSCSP